MKQNICCRTRKNKTSVMKVQWWPMCANENDVVT